MKKIIFFLFVIFLLITPFFSYADCNQPGTTIIFINGMFTFSKDQANDSKKDLEYQYKIKGKNNDVNFILGYNASHVGGLADILDVAQQAYAGGFLDYDLTNILRTTHNDSNTQKILLVGHSQGTFYTNAAYDYLVKDGGVDKNSISVYNVGTPADIVAGNGGYLTSSTDKVINYVRGVTTLGDAKKPLAANIDLKLSASEDADPLGGHSFSDVYLAEAPNRIIGDMDQEINNLAANSDKSECFVQPPTGVAYWITDTGYYIADNIGEHPEYFVTSPGPSQMASIGDSLLQGIYDFGKEIVSDVAQVLNQNKQIGAALSLPFVQNNNQSPPDTSDTFSSSIPVPAPDVPQVQFAGVQTAIAPVGTESVQDQLDDIQEKIDIIRQEVQALIAQQNSDIQLAEAQILQQQDDQNNDQDTDNKDKNKKNEDNAIVYPEILISEVQIDPIGQRFVELYNPNTISVPLTGWYLQRKNKNDTSWDSFVSSANFQNKIISARGYFLISRQLGNSDILSDITLSYDNSLALKNPNGDISDKLGFGSASDPDLSATLNPESAQSIGRKVSNGTEQDIGYNSADFELDTPTPRAQNITYVAPPAPGGDGGGGSVPVLKNILISEIQTDSIAGVGGTNDDWVELYNPNSISVSLAGWSIQKHSSDSPCSMNVAFGAVNFSNSAIIPANGYFLIVRNNASQSLLDIADMTSSYLQLSGNNTIYLVKSQNKIISGDDANISDKVGYGTSCFPENIPAINPPETESIGRKILPDGTEQDTDNNLNDFELQNPTPGKENKTYTPPSQNDTTAPIITLNGDIEITINIGDSYTDAGATALDNIDGDVTANIVIVNPVNVDTARDYTITYNVSDAAGNNAVQATRLVHVVTVPTVSKILINEIQIAGKTANDEFVELYNPNNFPIDLSGYALKKETASGSSSLSDLVSLKSKAFSGKTISALGYFLIVPQTGYLGTATPDLYYSGVSYSIAANNTVLLYGNSGNLADKVGFGTASDFKTAAALNPPANQSIQRKWDLTADNPQDTGDNSSDFGLGLSTPRLQNIVYSAPVDKTALESAVSDAIILLAAHPVGIEVGDVFQSDHDSYNDAIIAAKTVDSDSSATPAAVNSAISDLATATVTFNEAIITSVDQAAAQTVITQIAALPHPSTQLSTSIADNGTITDFQLPDFGYNPLPYICGADRICGIFVENGVPIGVYSGLNHWASHPYNWSILFASNGLDANVVFGSASGEDDFYIFPLDYGETDFNDCSSNFTETCASGSEYYLSFTHTGTTPGTGWATNSLIVTNSLTLNNAQAVSDAATAYNALTPTQQSLVTNYTTLQGAVIQIAALTDATAAVVNAEITPTQGNIDAANALMPAVADGAAKTSLQDRIDAVQVTVDANAAATLAAAKSTAHDALTTALGTYTETDYTPDNWTTLNGFKTAGDTEIDTATDLDGVTSAQNTAISGMAGVQTIT